jgi:hypothetical protein
MSRRDLHLLGPALLCVAAGNARVLAAQAAARTSPAITVADMRSRLFRIADDSMLGRETGSKGAFQTADYVAAEFRRVGLTPAGEQGGWFQAVPFWTGSSALRTLVIEGSAALHAGADFVVIPTFVTSTLDNTPAVYGGSLRDQSTWIDSAQASGKLVVLDGNPAAAGPTLRPMLNAAYRSPRFATARAVAIAQLGAIPPGIAVDFGRARVTRDTTRQPRPLALVITDRAADMILGFVSATRSPGAAGRVVRGDGGVQFVPTPFPARNVIGILPGGDPALRGEYVSITAHNDHVGVCISAVDHDSLRSYNRVVRPMGVDTPDRTPDAAEWARINQLRDSLRRTHPVRADSICNGADDDGTGTVAILELAAYFGQLPAAQRPRRSLLFVSHTGEERGLVGSAWFTDHATVPVDSIIAEIDEDMIGRGTAEDLPKGGPTYLEVVGARRLSNEFGDLLEAANREQPVPFVFNYEFDAPGHPLQYYCRADHYSYARYGIPSVAFSRGEHLDYHQVTDEAQYIDYPDMLRVVNMVRAAVTRIANLDHAPQLDKPKGDPHARCVQ